MRTKRIGMREKLDLAKNRGFRFNGTTKKVMYPLNSYLCPGMLGVFVVHVVS